MVVLKALFVGGPGGETYHTLYNRLPEFEGRTGVKVNIVDKMFYPDIYARLAKELDTGSLDYDVLSAHTSFVGSHSQFYMPLDEHFTEGELQDFTPMLIKASRFRGKLTQIPRHVDVRIMYYRSDLFNDLREMDAFKAQFGYDLKLPEDWDQLGEVAQFFTRPPNLYGFAFVGLRHPLAGTFMEMLASCGGSLIDETGKPAFNNESGKQALQFMVDLHRKWKVTPPNLLDFIYEDVSAAFREGRVAMVFDWPGEYGQLKDAKKSKVVGKVGFASYPIGPAGLRRVYGGAHSFAVAQVSQNVEAAVSLVKFLTSPESQHFQFVKEGFLPTRSSVWQRVQQEAEKSPDPLDPIRLKIFRQTIEEAYLPVKVTRWVDFYEAVWPELNAALRGVKTVEEALESAYGKALRVT